MFSSWTLQIINSYVKKINLLRSRIMEMINDPKPTKWVFYIKDKPADNIEDILFLGTYEEAAKWFKIKGRYKKKRIYTFEWFRNNSTDILRAFFFEFIEYRQTFVKNIVKYIFDNKLVGKGRYLFIPGIYRIIFNFDKYSYIDICSDKLIEQTQDIKDSTRSKVRFEIL